MAVGYSLVSGYDLAAGQIWDGLPRLSDISSVNIPWYVWTIGLLVILVLIAVEGGYRQYLAVEKRLEALKLEEDGLQQLIRATPNQGQGLKPIGSDTAWEIDAYLDVEPSDPRSPLRNCRIKLVEFEQRIAWTDNGVNKVRWNRDTFYQGQTYYFSWSGKASSVDAVDIHKSERAIIAKCVNQAPELTTTAGKVGHLFYGDEYHVIVEITADNSLSLTKEYWLQMYQHTGPVIEEWDASRRLVPDTPASQP